jgi:hypothetical protein
MDGQVGRVGGLGSCKALQAAAQTASQAHVMLMKLDDVYCINN